MNNTNQKMIDFLLCNANPTIVLRVKKEILNQLTESEERILLDKILLEKNVQTVIQSQKPDGWFGNNFHGFSGKRGAGEYDNMEVGMRYLAEKGFDYKHAILQKAMSSLLHRDSLDPDYNNCDVLKDDYEHACQGIHLSRSSILIRAGFENELPKNDKINLQFDIEQSLKSFLSVSDIYSTDEVLDNYKKVKVFKPNVLWPCSYDLRMLAFSNGWRTTKNLSLLASSVNKLLELPYDGIPVYNKIKSVLKSPCLAFIHKPVLAPKTNGIVSGFWFDYMELFARCGVVQKIDLLKDELIWLLSNIDNKTGICDIATDKYFHHYSPYSGLALEESPKTKLKKQCDITFRVLLINYYSQLTL